MNAKAKKGSHDVDPLGPMRDDVKHGATDAARRREKGRLALLKKRGDDGGAGGGSKLRSLFSKIDRDGDGRISKKEIRFAMSSDKTVAAFIKANIPGMLKPGSFAKIFGEVDGDSNGQLDFSEFQAAVRGVGLK